MGANDNDDFLTSNKSHLSYKHGTDDEILLRNDLAGRELNTNSKAHIAATNQQYAKQNSISRNSNDSFLSNEIPNENENYLSGSHQVSQEVKQIPANFQTNNLEFIIRNPASFDEDIDVDADNGIDEEDEIITITNENNKSSFEVPTRKENYHKNCPSTETIQEASEKKKEHPNLNYLKQAGTTRFPREESLKLTKNEDDNRDHMIPSCKKELSPKNLADFIFGKEHVYMDTNSGRMRIYNTKIRDSYEMIVEPNVRNEDNSDRFPVVFIHSDIVGEMPTVGGMYKGTLEGIIIPKLITNYSKYPYTRRAIPDASEFHFLVKTPKNSFEGLYMEIGSNNELDTDNYMMCWYKETSPSKCFSPSFRATSSNSNTKSGMSIIYAAERMLMPKTEEEDK